MPRESLKNKRARTEKIIAELKTAFPDARCSLDYDTPLQLLIATILSAQCTDERVNAVTKELFQVYATAESFAEAPQAEIEDLIRSTGFFRNKAKSIRACCRALVDHHGGRVPDSMESLTALAGVGRKTANVVLGNAFGKEEGVVVDTHLGRISNHLRLTRQKDPVKVEQDLMKVVPRDEWTLFSHLLIRHGRKTCRARKPDCASCPVRAECPSAL
ncbi:MAG: endonuclease III [Gemmatimonadetes bacterium]|nr:endonuclease III [Gemmatimonadota bacterium]|tara:strand:- start:2569 stop:3216 length:648 start_codon:yes stop_codon:yes gene_type:complete